jgi:4-amino-4-deoxy-L-arabinose transferase
MRAYALVLVTAAFLCAYILPLNVRQLAMPDETRYAEIPREMVASGDWIVPHLNGLRYFEKPVMGYWLTAISLKLFGEHRFAVRLPSALVTGLAALALGLLVRKITRRDSAALLTAAVFLTSVEVFGIGVFAVLDAVLSLFITLAMIFFFLAYAESAPPRKRLFLVFCGISCGMAFLTKGFLALAVPFVIVVPFLFLEKRMKDIFRLALIPAIAAVLTALPWAILVQLKESDYWRYFFWVEHVQRFFFAKMKQQHSEPIWYFVPVILAGFIPWTFLAPAVVKGLREEKEHRVLLKFALCWLIFPFILFSISHGKLATYILPCYAPMAILAAVGLVNYLGRDKTPAVKTGAVISAGFGLLIVGLVIFGQTVGIKSSTIFAPQETFKLVLAVIAACAWIVFALLSAVVRARFVRLALYAAAPLILLIVAPFVIPDRVNHDDRYMPEELIRRNMDKIRPDSLLCADGRDAPAICWILKRTDLAIMGDGGELSYGLSQNDSKHRLITSDVLCDKIKKGKSFGNIILINEPDDIAEFMKSMPKPLFKDTENAFLFAQF